MNIYSQIQEIIKTIQELQKTNHYCCIGLKVTEIMATKLMYFILSAHVDRIVLMGVKNAFQNFAIDSTSAALIPPDTLKGNLDIFQEKIMQDFKPMLLAPYSGLKDFCYTLLVAPVDSIATLACLVIFLGIISVIETIIIALLALSVSGLIVASPFSPNLREYMTKENAGIFGRAALVILGISPAVALFVTAVSLSIAPLPIASIFTRAGATIAGEFSSSPGTPSPGAM